LKMQFDSAYQGQSFLNRFYKSGMWGSKSVLSYTGDLDRRKEESLVRKIESFSSLDNLSGKIIPLPLGFSLQQLEMKLADAQFMELNKYSALQIASVFGIKPNQLNDNTTTYSNTEAQNKAYYNDTLLAILTNDEQELVYKLLPDTEIAEGYYIYFDVDIMLRAAFKERMEGYAKAISNGIYTPNEARNKENLPAKEGGDQLIVNGTYIPLSMAGQQYVKGGKTSE